jgi:hypothetical protein
MQPSDPILGQRPNANRPDPARDPSEGISHKRLSDKQHRISEFLKRLEVKLKRGEREFL